MKAIILVAGFGSRLRPLTDNTPKSLLPIGDTTTLSRMVKGLQANGIDEFVFVTGHFADKIEAFVSDHFKGITAHFVHNDKYQDTNTGYSLLLAEPFVRGETFIKFDGDVNYDDAILRQLLSEPEDANYICLDRTDVDDEVIKAAVLPNGRLSALGKHVPLDQAIGESIGIEKIAAQYSEQLFDVLKEVMQDKAHWQEYYEYAYDKLITDGVPFRYADITGLKWVEMDTRDDYDMAQRYFGGQSRPIRTASR